MVIHFQLHIKDDKHEQGTENREGAAEVKCRRLLCKTRVQASLLLDNIQGFMSRGYVIPEAQVSFGIGRG